MCYSSSDTGFKGNSVEAVGNTVNLLKHDLINFAQSEYHCVVDSVTALVEKFNMKYPGFKREVGEQTVLDVATKLQKWGWN